MIWHRKLSSGLAASGMTLTMTVAAMIVMAAEIAAKFINWSRNHDRQNGREKETETSIVQILVNLSSGLSRTFERNQSLPYYNLRANKVRYVFSVHWAFSSSFRVLLECGGFDYMPCDNIDDNHIQVLEENSHKNLILARKVRFSCGLSLSLSLFLPLSIYLALSMVVCTISTFILYLISQLVNSLMNCHCWLLFYFAACAPYSLDRCASTSQYQFIDILHLLLTAIMMKFKRPVVVLCKVVGTCGGCAWSLIACNYKCGLISMEIHKTWTENEKHWRQRNPYSDQMHFRRNNHDNNNNN